MEFDENYQCVLSDVKQIVLNGRGAAYQAANKAMITTYWNIGKRIVEDEQNGADRAKCGQKLIKLLAEELTAEFGKGISQRNLADFRRFFQVFPDERILQTRLQNLTQKTPSRNPSWKMQFYRTFVIS